MKNNVETLLHHLSVHLYLLPEQHIDKVLCLISEYRQAKSSGTINETAFANRLDVINLSIHPQHLSRSRNYVCSP